MATYDSLTAARAAYLANTDYSDGLGDLTKAQAFRSACRALLALMPQQTSEDQQSISMSVSSIRLELTAVDTWIASQPASTTVANSTGGGRRVLDSAQIRNSY